MARASCPCHNLWLGQDAQAVRRRPRRRSTDWKSVLRRTGKMPVQRVWDVNERWHRQSACAPYLNSGAVRVGCAKEEEVNDCVLWAIQSAG
ncbi:MAG: hypothetical protein NZ874_02690 [Fimbriimonadales bacterium]|nr:hypothetical protein [Fimbriimonadales bacterium]